MATLTSFNLTKSLIEIIEKHNLPVLKHGFYYEFATGTYSVHLCLSDFDIITISSDHIKDCLKKLDEELTYWKQHGVNPNV